VAQQLAELEIRHLFLRLRELMAETALILLIMALAAAVALLVVVRLGVALHQEVVEQEQHLQLADHQ
jgi:hypothetical protein